METGEHEPQVHEVEFAIPQAAITRMLEHIAGTGVSAADAISTGICVLLMINAKSGAEQLGISVEDAVQIDFNSTGSQLTLIDMMADFYHDIYPRLQMELESLRTSEHVSWRMRLTNSLYTDIQGLAFNRGSTGIDSVMAEAAVLYSLMVENDCVDPTIS